MHSGIFSRIIAHLQKKMTRMLSLFLVVYEEKMKLFPMVAIDMTTRVGYTQGPLAMRFHVSIREWIYHDKK
jgi:hypothetical protein